MMQRFLLALVAVLGVTFAGEAGAASSAAPSGGSVTVYAARAYKAEKELYDVFTAQTGIAVTVVSGKPAELIDRIKQEGADTAADVFIALDGGVLLQAKESGILQPVTAKDTLGNVPENLRDANNLWVGLTTRARVIAYAKDRVTPDMLSTYEDLADPKWKGKVVQRPGSALYNQSLLASLIELDGEKAAGEWVKGIAANFARPAKGNDRAQVTDLAAGTGDVTFVNTYYIGQMLNSKEAAEVEAVKKIGVFFPNQKTTGTHINVTGAGIVKGAKHKAGAEALIAYLTSHAVQERLAAGNYEYPANPKAKKIPLLEEFGEFTAQKIDFDALGKNKKKSSELMKQGGWE